MKPLLLVVSAVDIAWQFAQQVPFKYLEELYRQMSCLLYPSVDDAANFNQLIYLFKRRRSIREFLDKPVENEIIEKILDAAKTSPMGLPPTDVNVFNT